MLIGRFFTIVSAPQLRFYPSALHFALHSAQTGPQCAPPVPLACGPVAYLTLRLREQGSRAGLSSTRVIVAEHQVQWRSTIQSSFGLEQTMPSLWCYPKGPRLFCAQPFSSGIRRALAHCRQYLLASARHGYAFRNGRRCTTLECFSVPTPEVCPLWELRSSHASSRPLVPRRVVTS